MSDEVPVIISSTTCKFVQNVDAEGTVSCKSGGEARSIQAKSFIHLFRDFKKFWFLGTMPAIRYPIHNALVDLTVHQCCGSGMFIPDPGS